MQRKPRASDDTSRPNWRTYASSDEVLLIDGIEENQRLCREGAKQLRVIRDRCLQRRRYKMARQSQAENAKVSA